MNLGIALGFNVLAVFAFALFPKPMIIGGFIAGPALTLGWMIFSAVKEGTSYQTAIDAGGFLVAPGGSAIGYYYLRNVIDTIAVLLKAGGRIVLMNFFTFFVFFILFVALLLGLVFVITIGFFRFSAASVIMSLLSSFFALWSGAFFYYLYDVFTAGIVTGTVIKHTPRDQEEREMKVGGCAVVNTFWAMGTASFASLIIGLLNIMKQAVEGNAHSRVHEGVGILIIRFILKLLVSFVEQLVEAVNKFALCYTAIKGEGFVNSVKGSWGCIKNGGFVAFNSYYAVEYAIYFINFLASLIGMAANYGYYRSFMKYDEFSIFMMIFDMIISLLFIISFTRIISSASNALAFIFVLDRERIKQYNVELYNALSKIAVEEKEIEKKNTNNNIEWPFFELSES